MKIITHRGLWRNTEEQNTEAAFHRSFTQGFGTETDLRDRLGEIVIANDPACAKAPSVAKLLDTHRFIAPDLILALDVKSDGLAPYFARLIEQHPVQDFFFFDMSMPEMPRYHAAGLPFFTRQSDLEPEPVLLAEADGVWIESFHEDSMISQRNIARHLENKHRVCIASPELHNRDPRPVWDILASCSVIASPDLILCTDRAEEAAKFFGLKY